jgi:dTDP-4-amino-4,6-dideoxygalactose transaminase
MEIAKVICLSHNSPIPYFVLTRFVVGRNVPRVLVVVRTRLPIAGILPMTAVFGHSLVAQVPLLDVGRANGPLREGILAAMERVFDSGRFLYGPDVTQLEQSLARRCGARHAIACASGSDALLLALMALGIEPGDEVIVPSFTFFATASAVSRLGAKIVFADIDPVTYNMDPGQLSMLITPRTKAVIPVHLYGQCADMAALNEIAQRHKLSVVEDAAQSIGAAWLDRPAGNWGDVTCISFYPTKNLGGCGDGGMVVTSDESLEKRLRLFSAHGMQPRYFHKVVGINSRLDSLQAAALNVKLTMLDQWTADRQENAARYHELFHEAGLEKTLQLPVARSGATHVWNQYTIRVPEGRRDALRNYLAQNGVGSEIYYPHPLHLQECFADLGYRRGSLPNTERASAEVLSLPIFPGLTADEQYTVVQRIFGFYAQRQSIAA